MGGKHRRSRFRHLRRHRSRHRRKATLPETRDWLELPQDVLSVIFQKLGGIEVLWPAQAVCHTWRRLALEPQTWRCIDMRGHSELFNMVDMAALARTAVDRSGGRVEEFYTEYFGNDELLNYVADRTTGLRVLVLISAYDVSEEGLVEFVQRCPLLEELQIISFGLQEGTYADIGRARPELKRFRLNTNWYKRPNYGISDSEFDCDSYALEVADTMPQLRELQLIGNQLTNKGLHAILDKCTCLESLDIRACLNVKLDDRLQSKLSRVKNVKLPRDSTADYEFITELEEEAYPSGFSGIDQYTYDDMFGIDFDFDSVDYDATQLKIILMMKVFSQFSPDGGRSSGGASNLCMVVLTS